VFPQKNFIIIYHLELTPKSYELIKNILETSIIFLRSLPFCFLCKTISFNIIIAYAAENGETGAKPVLLEMPETQESSSFFSRFTSALTNKLPSLTKSTAEDDR
jgi:hypothetical protein